MHVTLTNKTTNAYKDVKVGFSWTTFFFGLFPALFRGDWKWAAIIFLTAVAAGSFTMGIGAIVFDIIWACVYNKLYTKDLIGKGYEPSNQGAAQILVSKGYIPTGYKFN